MEPVGTDIVPPLAICPNCERSIVLIDGTARLANADDTNGLTPDQSLALKKLKTKTRADRLAYYKQHHA
jgi:hypothetical protein